MVVAVGLLNDVVYDSRGCYARLDDLESVGIVDVARYRVRVAALSVIRDRGSVMGRVVIGRTNSNRQCYQSKCDCRASSSQQILSRNHYSDEEVHLPAIPKSHLFLGTKNTSHGRHVDIMLSFLSDVYSG